MFTENVDSVVVNERTSSNNVKATGNYFDTYHVWEEVHDYIESLAVEFPQLAGHPLSEPHSKVGCFVYIVSSYLHFSSSGRPIKIITLSTAPSAKKPSLWFDGGLHAREWITVPTVTYFADTILRGYGLDANATFLLDAFDVIICPIVNLDGYDYTR